MVLVLPGFTRQASDLKLFVQQVHAAGLNCTALTLAPRFLPFMYMNTWHLRSLASKIKVDFPHSSVVLVGHSAGAAAATYMATVLLEIGVRVKGVIYADGVDSPNHLIARYLPQLDGTPVHAVLAPSSPCNRKGRLERFLIDYPWVGATFVAGAGHGDIEGTGVAVYRKYCNDTSSAQVSEKFRRTLIHHIEVMAARTD